MEFGFEWDLKKAEANAAKYGVTCDEPASVFLDPLTVTVPDASHSAGEDRVFTIGLSNRERLISVFHTDRRGRIRIIIARLATRRERRTYETSE